MFLYMTRTFILYFLIMFTMRLMGKKQVGELEPYELVIAIIISDLATMPMQDIRLPLINGITPIITMLFIEMLLSFFQFRSRKFRKKLDGQAAILVKDGIVDLTHLKEQEITLNELLEEIRSAGYLDLSEVEYAVLETKGKLSVIPSKEYNNKILPKVVFCNGKFYEDNLKRVRKSISWVHDELKKSNLCENDIDFAIVDSNSSLVFQKKGANI